MLSVEQMLKIDPGLSDLSEDELCELRTVLYDMANLAFEVKQEKKDGSKNPVGDLPKPPISSML